METSKRTGHASHRMSCEEPSEVTGIKHIENGKRGHADLLQPGRDLFEDGREW
jgi:hypothetical protein